MAEFMRHRMPNLRKAVRFVRPVVLVTGVGAAYAVAPDSFKRVVEAAVMSRSSGGKPPTPPSGPSASSEAGISGESGDLAMVAVILLCTALFWYVTAQKTQQEPVTA
jgi:hypothetical protein